MKKWGFVIFLLVACCVLLVRAVFVQTISITTLKTATVSIETPNKLKRGNTATLQVKVDLSGVMLPASNQPASLAGYVIPISFDRSALEFVAAAGGDSLGFALVSVTSAERANAKGLVTLVGSQTTADATTGIVGVASLEFRVIASQKGKTKVSVNPELAEPGLSISTTLRQGMMLELYRVPASGQSSVMKIK